MANNGKTRRIRVMEPQIIKQEVLVKVPVVRSTILVKSDVDRAEEYFTIKRDNAKSYAEKHGFDTCRAVVKWATTCGAKIIKYENSADDYGAPTIDFVFCFSSVQALDDFSKDFNLNVGGSIM